MPDIFVAPKNSQNKEISAARSPSLNPDISGRDQKTLSPAPQIHNHPNVLSSFCVNPTNISFQNQEEGENILLFLRRHFITNLPWILITILLIFVPVILSIVFSVTKTPTNFLPPRFVTFLILFYYLLVFTYTLVSFFTWFFNISLITEERVINISFSDLVYKNVSATKLDLVQDASYSQIGVIRNIFDYGDVLIQTAGSLDNFDLLAVPHPERTIQIVEDLIGKGSHAF